jgi:hypothetical protein
MLSLADIAARIDAQCAIITRARVVADFDAVFALMTCNPPEAFVGNYRVASGDNLSLGATLQDSIEFFSVWIAIRRTLDSSGEVWQANLSTPSAQVCAAIVDYQPSELDMPIYKIGAEIEQSTRHLVFWRIDFAGKSFEKTCL